MAAEHRRRGTAQMLRDARIAMIYEGTSGIQALDLVGRKLTMADGRLMSVSASGARSEHSPSRSVADCGDPTPRPGI